MDINDANLKAFGQAVQQQAQPYQGTTPQTAQQALEQAQGYDNAQRNAVTSAQNANRTGYALNPRFSQFASINGFGPGAMQVYGTQFGGQYLSADEAANWGKAQPGTLDYFYQQQSPTLQYVDANGLDPAMFGKSYSIPGGASMYGQQAPGYSQHFAQQEAARRAAEQPATYFMGSQGGGFSGVPANFQNIQAPNFNGYNPMAANATQWRFF